MSLGLKTLHDAARGGKCSPEPVDAGTPSIAHSAGTLIKLRFDGFDDHGLDAGATRGTACMPRL